MKRIALSPGDPAGIGPEVCLKSLLKNKSEISRYELLGDIEFYKKLSSKLELNLSFEESSKKNDCVQVKNIPLIEEVDLGFPAVANSKYVLDVLMTGALGCLSRDYSCLL